MNLHPWLILMALVAALGGLAHYADGWATDNRVEIWLRGREGLEQYQILQQRFGGDEVILVRLKPSSEEDARAMTAAKAMGLQLAELPSVSQVLDPFRLPGAAKPGTQNAWLGAQQRPLAQALGLIGQASLHFDFLLQLDPSAGQAERSQLASALQKLREEKRGEGLELYIAGHPLVSAALDAESKQVQRVFAPMLALVAIMGVWLLLRSLPIALLSAFPALLGASAIRAGYRAMQWDANLILVSAGPIMLVILLASALHLSSAYLRLLGEGVLPVEAARQARKEKFSAGLLAAITTSMGFAVFLSSSLEPVRRLGMGVASGIIVFVPAFYIFLPTLLSLVKKGPSYGRHKTPSTAFGDLALSSYRFRKVTIALSALALIGGFFAFQNLGSNTNALRYFPESDHLKQDFTSIEADGTGLTTVEVLARHLSGETWRQQDSALASVAGDLHAFPGTRGTFGPTDVLHDLANTASNVDLLGGLAMRRAERLGEKGEWARWTLRLPSGGSESVLATVEAIRTRATSLEESLGLETIVTGTMPLMLNMQDDLIGTLVRSLSLTLLATFLFFLLVTRSWRQRVGVMVVNLVPVACSMMAGYALGFELDAASVMVAAVVLSLAVDNTFHLLHAFHKTESTLEGMRTSFRRVGPPAAISACALAVGFASLAFSGFTPTARFGLLTAIGAAASLPADLILLPAFLLPSFRDDV